MFFKCDRLTPVNASRYPAVAAQSEGLHQQPHPEFPFRCLRSNELKDNTAMSETGSRQCRVCPVQSKKVVSVQFRK